MSEGDPPRERAGKERGQASVELVAALPALFLALLVAAQLALAGYALWSAALAARAGARASAIGAAVAPAARRALPAAFRASARVRSNGEVEVRVSMPRVVPGLPPLRVSASSNLSPRSNG
jgi:hypothetical protein